MNYIKISHSKKKTRKILIFFKIMFLIIALNLFCENINKYNNYFRRQILKTIFFTLKVVVLIVPCLCLNFSCTIIYFKSTFKKGKLKIVFLLFSEFDLKYNYCFRALAHKRKLDWRFAL